MKLTNYIVTIILGGTLCLSCRNEYIENQRYVGEGIVFTTPYSSRSAVYTAWEEGDRIGVMGYCDGYNGGQEIYADLWDAKKDFVTPDIFYNQPLTYEGNGNWTYDWDNQGLHPWLGVGKENAKYTFIAYFPYTDDGIIGNGEGTFSFSGQDFKGEPTFKFTMPHTGSDSDTDLRLEVADVMMATRKDHTKADGTVGLNFEHMLTAMEFEVNNYNLDKSVTINKIAVKGSGFYKEFTVKGVNIEDYSVADATYMGAFNVQSEPITLEMAKGNMETGEIVPTTTKISNADGSPLDLLFIVDQNHKIFSENGECSVVVTTVNGTTRSLSLKEGNVTFTRGVKNIFSINYVGNDFLLQVRADENWEIGGDDNIYFD